MAELNFNALIPEGPRGFYQGFEQGQDQRIAREANQIKLDELKRDRDEAMQLQAQLKSMGQDPDLNKYMDTLIATGKPEYVQMAIEGKQKLKDLEAYAKLGGGGTAAPAMPTGAPAPSVMRMPQAPAATNALGSGMFGMEPSANALAAQAAPMAAPAPAPVNALAPQAQQAQARITQLLDFARTNPRMAKQAMEEARLLQDQLELFSKRGQNEPADMAMMRQLGYPLTQEGFQAYQNSKRQDRLLTPAELQQKLQIAAASRAPGTTVTMVSERAEQGARGKMLVENFDAVSKAAQLAAKTIPSIESNLNVLNNGFDTGFGTETKAAGASVLAALGVKDADKYATNAQTFLSNANAAVLQKQLEQKGPQTESDAQRINAVGAQLGKTKDANQFVLNVAKEQLKRDIEQRNFYANWYKTNKTYDGAEDAWYAGKGGESLFASPALKKYTAPTAANAAPAAGNRPSLNDIFKK